MKNTSVLALLLLSFTLLVGAQQPAPPSPQPNPSVPNTVSEITELRVSNAYQKVVLAQENLNNTIKAFNQAILQGRETEKLPPTHTLQYDPQTDKTKVIPLPQQPAQAKPANDPAPPPPGPAQSKKDPQQKK